MGKNTMIMTGLVKKKNSRILIVAFCLYFIISIFEVYINGTIGAITKYYIIALAAYILLSDKTLKIKKITIPFFIWLCYKCLSLLWTTDYATPSIHIVSQIGMVLFIFALSNHYFTLFEINKIVNAYFFSSCALSVLCVFFSRAYHGFFTNRQVVTLFGVENDPNNLGALILVGFSISLFRLFSSSTVRERLINIVLILICTIGGLKTGSRATLVSMIIVFIFVVFLLRRKALRSIIIGFILLVVAYYFLRNYLPAAVYERLFVLDYGNGSGRVEMWGNVWNEYSKDIITVLFGIGWGSATINTGTSLAVHNTFLTMLCDVGLIGTIVFFAPVAKMGLSLYKKKEYLPVVLMLSQFIPAFFLDSINKRFFWNAIFILMIYYLCPKEMMSKNEDSILFCTI